MTEPYSVFPAPGGGYLIKGVNADDYFAPNGNIIYDPSEYGYKLDLETMEHICEGMNIAYEDGRYDGYRDD